MQLAVDTFPSKHFSHFPNSKRMVCEVSDLASFEGFKPLYDDAADVGIALRNSKTGNVTRWHLADEIRDPQEGELMGWYLRPCYESVRRNPVLKDYSMTLIND